MKEFAKAVQMYVIFAFQKFYQLLNKLFFVQSQKSIR